MALLPENEIFPVAMEKGRIKQGFDEIRLSLEKLKENGFSFSQCTAILGYLYEDMKEILIEAHVGKEEFKKMTFGRDSQAISTEHYIRFFGGSE